MQIRLHVYANQPCSGKANNLADISEAHNHRWSFRRGFFRGVIFTRFIEWIYLKQENIT